jgi:hypothetical protein
VFVCVCDRERLWVREILGDRVGLRVRERKRVWVIERLSVKEREKLRVRECVRLTVCEREGEFDCERESVCV